MLTVFEKVFKQLEGTIYQVNEYNKLIIYEELEKLPMQLYPRTDEEAFQFILTCMESRRQGRGA
jgi:hypothetical protein